MRIGNPAQMHSAFEFLLHHGYVVLLGWVFAEQIGVPVPSLLILLAAGALAGAGRFSFVASVFLSGRASLAPEFVLDLLRPGQGIKNIPLLFQIFLVPR